MTNLESVHGGGVKKVGASGQSSILKQLSSAAPRASQNGKFSCATLSRAGTWARTSACCIQGDKEQVERKEM